MRFELLLTDLRTMEPALRQAPALSSVHHVEQPTMRTKTGLAVPGHSNDLAREGWGVVIPATAAGEERLAWIRQLSELRQRQCGLTMDALQVLRVPPGVTGREARAWRAKYEAMHPALRPDYLLLLGDLDELSLDLQQELMVSACVGRLCFTTLDGAPDRAGYEAYCAKVCSAEAAQRRAVERARLLFYAAHDGTQAIDTGYLDLIRRCHLDAGKDGQLGADAVRLFGSAADHQWYTDEADLEARERTLAHWAEQRHPAVLLSMTHGAGATDPAAQRLRQGAVVLGESAGRRRTQVLDHEFFARPFLPAGFWFFKACFGAGTPTTSVYQRWFDSLYRLGIHSSDPRIVQTYLAPARPFVARLPQVALAQPDGPLGILGHVDLAWIFGFQSLDEIDGKSVQPEHGPYYDVVRAVVGGSRFGVAVASLSEKVQEIGTHLVTLYGDSDFGGRMSDARRVLRAWLWMRYLDLAGYILLGDPAAQVPTCAAQAVAAPARRRRCTRTKAAPARPSMRAEPTMDMEGAVLAYLQHRQLRVQIAEAAGVCASTLDHWVSTYQHAGRAALSVLVRQGDGPADDS